MTEPDRKFEEEIRRALCAASDLVVPAGDGLNKIRERTARRPPLLGWFLASAAHLPRQLVRGGRVAASEVAATAHGSSSLGLLLAAARRWPGQARHALRTPGIWVRPALAGATALLLVLAVTLSIPRLRQQMTAQLDSAFGQSSGSGPSGQAGGGGGGAQSNGAAPIIGQSTTPMAGQPFLATMPPGSTQCRDQGSSGTVAARTNAGAAGPVGTVRPDAVPSGDVGPLSASDTCSAATAPTGQATSPPATQPATTAVTTPPVAATTPLTTTTPAPPPTTTPPVTTSPATTPPTTSPPPTTPPTQTSTSSTNTTPAAGVPTDTAAPGA